MHFSSLGYGVSDRLQQMRKCVREEHAECIRVLTGHANLLLHYRDRNPRRRAKQVRNMARYVLDHIEMMLTLKYIAQTCPKQHVAHSMDCQKDS